MFGALRNHDRSLVKSSVTMFFVMMLDEFFARACCVPTFRMRTRKRNRARRRLVLQRGHVHHAAAPRRSVRRQRALPKRLPSRPGQLEPPDVFLKQLCIVNRLPRRMRPSPVHLFRQPRRKGSSTRRIRALEQCAPFTVVVLVVMVVGCVLHFKEERHCKFCPYQQSVASATSKEQSGGDERKRTKKT